MWAFWDELTCSWVTEDRERTLLHPANSHRPAARPHSIDSSDRLIVRLGGSQTSDGGEPESFLGNFLSMNHNYSNDIGPGWFPPGPRGIRPRWTPYFPC